ncbi:MAG: hypothetical protein HQ538_05105 [Parcubacteria group bacterium]|nr:hypothetical protein [Parcubacteria group bacterium]
MRKKVIIIGILVILVLIISSLFYWQYTKSKKVYVEQVKFEIKYKPFEIKNELQKTIISWSESGITTGNIDKVEVKKLKDGYGILIVLDENGRNMFKKVTSENINKRIAIFIDDVPISAPIVTDTITDGKMSITGDFNKDEAYNLKTRLLGYYLSD